MPARTWIALVVNAALWGAAYLFIKVALDGGISEGGIVLARTALAALVLVPFALRERAFAAVRTRPRWILLLALLQTIAPFGLIAFGQNHVPSALTSIIVASSPLFVALLAPWLDPSERSEGWALVGVLLGMVGVGALFGLDLSVDASAVFGGGLILLAALSYALSGFVIKNAFVGVPLVGVAAAANVIGALVWLPVALASLPDEAPGLDVVGALLALGIGGTGLGMLYFYRLIGRIGPARAWLIAYIAPAFAVIYGVVLLDEELTAGTFLGLGLILVGSYLAGGRRAEEVPVTVPAAAPPQGVSRGSGRS